MESEVSIASEGSSLDGWTGLAVAVTLTSVRVDWTRLVLVTVGFLTLTGLPVVRFGFTLKSADGLLADAEEVAYTTGGANSACE